MLTDSERASLKLATYREGRQWPNPFPAVLAWKRARIAVDLRERELTIANLPPPRLYPQLSIPQIRRTMIYPSPVVHAVCDDGEEIRMSFYHPQGVPWDFERARECALGCLRADVLYGDATRMKTITHLDIIHLGKKVRPFVPSKRKGKPDENKIATLAGKAYQAITNLLDYLPPEAVKVRDALFQIVRAA